MIHHDTLWTFDKLAHTAPMILLAQGGYTAIIIECYL